VDRGDHERHGESDARGVNSGTDNLRPGSGIGRRQLLVLRSAPRELPRRSAQRPRPVRRKVSPHVIATAVHLTLALPH